MTHIIAKYKNGLTLRAKSSREMSSLLSCSIEDIELYILGHLPDRLLSVRRVGDNKPSKRRNTVYGRACEMWSNIQSRLKYQDSYKDVTLGMRKNEFLLWAMPKIKDSFDKEIDSPSIDRINPSDGYNLNNIQIVSKHKNCAKQFTDRPELREKARKSSRKKFSKKVRLTTIDGSSKIYDSASDIDRELKRHHGYTYYRLIKERPLPEDWESIEYYEKKTTK